MLSNNPPASQPMTIAYRGNRMVSLAIGLHCHCGRSLAAHDVQTDSIETELICPACHCDVLVVEEIGDATGKY